ncbi:MAG: Spy/CpxP family protein refolding chaperone [Halothiobacillus sp.]
MNNIRRFKKLTAYAFAAVLTGSASAALAAQPETPNPNSYAGGYGPGMMGGYGPGMMGGYGPGMMGGYGPGMMGGYGPGMMGGYGPGMMGGHGPGMMGGCGSGMMGGYGPGMMGGYGPGMMGGYGPGMMGGYGPGMMRGYWRNGSELTEAQRTQINKIQNQTRKENWALMGEIQDQQAKLRDLSEAPKPDNAAMEEAYKAIGKLQQQMYQNSVDAHKQMDATLAK